MAFIGDVLGGADSQRKKAARREVDAAQTRYDEAVTQELELARAIAFEPSASHADLAIKAEILKREIVKDGRGTEMPDMMAASLAMDVLRLLSPTAAVAA